MAVRVTRHYNFAGTSTAQLADLTPGNAAVVLVPGDGVDVAVDSTSTVDLDAAMVALGFVPGTVIAGPTWQKVTKTFADFAAAAFTNDIEVLQLPAGGYVHSAVIKHSVSFGGGTIATYTISVGVASNFVKYLPAFDVHQAPGDTVFALNDSVGAIETFGAVTSIRARAISTIGLLNAANAGSVDIWLLTSTLP